MEHNNEFEWWETFDGILGKLKELKDENSCLKEDIKLLEDKLHGTSEFRDCSESIEKA